MNHGPLLSSKEIADAILASMQAVHDIVTAFAKQNVLLPHGTRTKKIDLRAAPGFARGINLDAPSRVLYTSRDVAEELARLGNAPSLLDYGVTRTGKSIWVAGRWVQVALALLEHFELFPDEEREIIANIKEGRPGYRTNSLLETLRARKKATKLLTTNKRHAPSCVVRKQSGLTVVPNPSVRLIGLGKAV
jgi:hypothetical protein